MRPPKRGGGGATICATESHPTGGGSEHPARKVHLKIYFEKYSLHKNPVFRTFLASAEHIYVHILLSAENKKLRFWNLALLRSTSPINN